MPEETNLDHDYFDPNEDPVVLPSHYKCFAIEPIRFCQVNNLSVLQGKVVKYLLRYPHKNGVEDLLKAKRCLEMLIAYTEGDPDWWGDPRDRLEGDQPNVAATVPTSPAPRSYTGGQSDANAK